MADEKPKPLPFIDNPHAPEIFATDAAGFFNLNGCIAITLEAVKSDYSTSPGTISRVVAGRLVLTADGARALSVGLYDFLKKQGIVADPPAEKAN
jgi:predicted deacylase